jgi:hypothetical protein
LNPLTHGKEQVMKRFMMTCFMVALTVAGCGSYNAVQVPQAEPKGLSYCQRIDDMAVGMEPYMVKDKTALTFDSNMRKDQVMALYVSTVADGGSTYKVRRSDITAMDEFGNAYAPSDPKLIADRVERAFRKDEPALYDDLKKREMPDEVTVSNKSGSYFVYFDMMPAKAEARRLTVHVPASSADGSKKKDFSITVDPFRGVMDPAERWDSYDVRGVTPCGVPVETKTAQAPAAPTSVVTGGDDAARAEEAARRAEEAAKKAEAAANKNQKVFEKSLEK